MSHERKKKTPAEEEYADIIGCNRPEDPEVLSAHPKMDAQERAKIFAPFAALRGHAERLEEEDEKLSETGRACLSEEETARLDKILSSLTKGMRLSVTYFSLKDPENKTGSYETLSGTLTGLDPVAKTLRVEDTLIPFEDLFDLIPLP